MTIKSLLFDFEHDEIRINGEKIDRQIRVYADAGLADMTFKGWPVSKIFNFTDQPEYKEVIDIKYVDNRP